MSDLQPHDAPTVFLAGPSGSGKSALGRRVCAELGLRFIDLVDDGSTDAALQELVRAGGADVVTVPWEPASEARWLDLCRRSGATVGLWSHPLDMQERSGRTQPLFTPVRNMTTRGGFGRTGSRCREYRRLARACEYVLSLVDKSEEAAAQVLGELIEDLRTHDSRRSSAEHEGLLGWRNNWRRDFDADPRACEILVDAMARFTMDLRARGASPRRMADVYTDLNSAGFVVMCCDAPKGKRVLDAFVDGPCEHEFERLISDSPRALARYRSTWEAFERFLRDSGMLDDGGRKRR